MIRTLIVALALTACSQPQASTPANTPDTIDTPLTTTSANAANGARIFLARDAGHCVLCHQVANLDAPFQGNVGPALTGIGNRLTPAQLRLRLVDASVLNPNTVMPPYYRTDGLTRVDPALKGQPVLSAQDIEDLIAYLASLKEDPA